MVNGALTIMKPDFSRMTREDLKAYILAHREDDDAIEALIKHRNSNSPKHRFPKTDEDLMEMEKILKQKLGASDKAV
jgi:hypothetical protein